MENQARLESENSSNMNFSATGRASYSLFSAEASASGGSSASLKSFSQAISKVAKKASQSINQQNREEVSTSSSVKTTVSNKDETSATIRNINQGRTLNLLFFRLNNKFQGGIYLDDLQFEVIPSMEIIAGSGVYESLRFTLDEMPEMLEQFQQTRLPFDIVSDDSGKTSFLRKVVGSLKSLLEKEYMSGGEQRAESGRKAVRRFSEELPETATTVARVSLGPAPVKAARRSRKSVAVEGTLDTMDTELADFVTRLRNATIDCNSAILSDDLILASSGLYLDTVVGALASTEPYSEEMRAQEIRMRDAEVRKTLAEAEHQLALAASMSPGGAVGADGNWIIGIFVESAQNSLRLRLRQPLTKGRWDLMLDDTRKVTIQPDMTGQQDLSHTWDRPQKWLKENDLIRRIALKERVTGERVEFLK
jgi:hypothetical protein